MTDSNNILRTAVGNGLGLNQDIAPLLTPDTYMLNPTKPNRSIEQVIMPKPRPSLYKTKYKPEAIFLINYYKHFYCNFVLEQMITNIHNNIAYHNNQL